MTENFEHKYIMAKEVADFGGRGAIQIWNEEELPKDENGNYTYAWFPSEFMNIFYQVGKKCAGFVNPTFNEDGTEIINLEWDEESYQSYLATLPKWYENLIPTKINELSQSCEQAIIAGTDVTLSDGTQKRFEYTLADQSNLANIFNSLIIGGVTTGYPYHAKDEECKLYSTQDLLLIYVALNMNTTYHQTYFNQLKAYVNSFIGTDDDNESIVNEINYGMELTGEYLEKCNNLVSTAQEQINAVVSKITASLSQ